LLRGEKEIQKIYERKKASRLEGGGGLKGLQTIIGLKGRVGGIYSAPDIQMFCATITHVQIDDCQRGCNNS